MECYDQKWCPDGECDLCDFWMVHGVRPREARWLRLRRFFIRLWRRDFSAGYVNLNPRPIYATHEDALRDVMKSGRAAVFEEAEEGGYVKAWEDGAPSAKDR